MKFKIFILWYNSELILYLMGFCTNVFWKERDMMGLCDNVIMNWIRYNRNYVLMLLWV
jgi:hypothetical protein